MSDFKRNQLSYTAYIEVAEWCDRETAYNLIQKIKDPRKEARIVYEDDNWWAVEEYAEDELCFTSNPDYMPWTTVFEELEELEELEKKQVRFKRGLEIEENMTVEDIDIRLECKHPNLDFESFCIGFGNAYGFDFEAEFKAWVNLEEEKAISQGDFQKAEAIGINLALDPVIEMGF